MSLTWKTPAGTSPGAEDGPARAIEAFLKIFLADDRLWVLGEMDAVKARLEALIVQDTGRRWVVNGGGFYEQFIAARVPGDATLLALIRWEPHLERLGIGLIQPMALAQLSEAEREKLKQAAPQVETSDSGSDRKRARPGAAAAPAGSATAASPTPSDILKQPQKKRHPAVAAAVSAVVIIGLGIALLVSLPDGISGISLQMPPDGVPCSKVGVRGTYLFCVVDEAKLPAENDKLLRARILRNQDTAARAGYREMLFLKAGPEQRRFRPELWQRGAAKGAGAAATPSTTGSTAGTKP